MEIKNLCDKKKEVANNNILFEINKNRFDKNFRPSDKIDFSELRIPSDVLKKQEASL